MNAESPESFSSGCDNQIELLVSNAVKQRELKRETEVHGIGYDPFSYCGRRIHVLLLAKIISLLIIPFYFSIVVFITFFGNATSVMFSVIILGSVAIFTVFGAFRGAKMCLIPFLILQMVFLVYDVILIGIGLMTFIFPHLFISRLLRLTLEDVPMATNLILFSACLLLALLIGPLIWSTHVMYLNFLFISHIDETLHMLKEANQKVSQDDVSPNRMNF